MAESPNHQHSTAELIQILPAFAGRAERSSDPEMRNAARQLKVGLCKEKAFERAASGTSGRCS